ncbi:hypothetical protein JS73_07815 [Synergistes jonesii]|uniref:Aspartate/glutamate racemase family protein n=2 Tax=Synergistes jonesii TaxID=2754 RepID=A0A073J334_9BACT|nr:hypothetical protein EH55_05690 [Synergistes jonesii]OFB60670.1 hypothetical protein JS72_13000 [Synergistes jonesii]OFB62345.1 hypothetical protein JS73_07815 [Synergistes jonesii]OFB67545.1 hypothetical protein JS78_07820 [Synergistes jonesii]OFB69802.1 hypothetical protein JS77_07835 [Synergistes jonesii]
MTAMKRFTGIARGGRNIYGFSLGILMLDTDFPRIPGEIGNALTWDFPVLYKLVRGASVQRVVSEGDPTLLNPFIYGAKELIAQGAQAITTSCGFLAIFQRELAEALSVPVFTSALLIVPLVYSMLPEDSKIGIMTFNGKLLTERHFRGAGIENIPKVVYGMEDSPHFARPIRENTCELDVDGARADHMATARKMCRENPDVRAIVLECTNMPPYADDIREATGLPVFDITDLTKFVYGAVPKSM